MNDFAELMKMLDDIENAAIELNIEVEVKNSKSTDSGKSYTSDSGEEKIAKQKARNARANAKKDIQKQKSIYTEKRRELQKIVSEKARVANKRLDRLAKNNLQMQSAYRQWLQQGGKRFSTRGMSYQELQSEYWRVMNFLNSETSTVRGAVNHLRNMVGSITSKLTAKEIKSMSIQELQSFTKNYWNTYNAIQYIYEQANMNAKKLDSQRIIQMVDEYIEQANIDVLSDDLDLSDLEDLGQFILQYEAAENALDSVLSLW